MEKLSLDNILLIICGIYSETKLLYLKLIRLESIQNK
jgi:hypothetical protein